jgi:hypothetical protein
MARFTSAVAVALAAAIDPADREIYRHSVLLEVPIVRGACNAPQLIQKLLQQLKTDEIDISFRGSSLEAIDTEIFPTDKAIFDTLFRSYSIKKTNGEFVVLNFEIRSARHLRLIKESVWALLVDNNLYLNSSPGDTSKVGLKPMGFITKLHPKTASLTAAHYDLEGCIQQAIDDADDNILLELGITNNKIAVTLASDRLRGVFRNDKITSNGVVVFSEVKDLDRNYTLLEHFSEGMWDHGHVFVPFSLRREQPEVYGQYLALQNVFLKDHRNISLCGIGPEVLDYEANPTTEDSYSYSDSIWQQLAGLPGVYRVDPTKRTCDLGKWNISCDTKNYLAITEWIDTNLLTLFRKVPADIRAKYSHKDFDEPARLNRNFRVSNGNQSVRSNMTGTSSRYQQSLVSHLSNYTALPTVERNPWQTLQSRPMKEIKYTHEDRAFPPLKTSNDTKSTAAETTADMTTISAITDSVIHVAVKDAFEALKTEHRDLEKQWQLKFEKLEAKMEDLSKSVASDVISAMLQSDNMPFLQKTDFFAQMSHQTSAMTAIMEASNSKVNDIKTMFTSIEATLRDGPKIASPPRNKQRTLRDPMKTDPKDAIQDPLSTETAGESK